MAFKFSRIISKLRSFKWIVKGSARPSFSQVGEDVILSYLFETIGLNNPTYLEVGTNHPVHGNNTYAFYLRGCRGVLVEPDPELHTVIKRYRPDDKLITSGIALEEKDKATFYVFPQKYTGWNTFSEEEVTIRKNDGIPYEKAIEVSLMNINNVIRDNFSAAPDFINIDVEGLDEEIIKSLDFEKNAPKVICIETLRFGHSDHWEKQQTLTDLIISKGYFLYADTFVNSIFCKKELIR